MVRKVSVSGYVTFTRYLNTWNPSIYEGNSLSTAPSSPLGHSPVLPLLMESTVPYIVICMRFSSDPASSKMNLLECTPS